MTTEQKLPIFIKSSQTYGIIIIEGEYIKTMYNIKSFNMEVQKNVKKFIEQNPDSLKEFFKIYPESVLFEKSKIDFNLIILCSYQPKSQFHDNDKCTKYCNIICNYFKDSIISIYTDKDKLIEDYPEAIQFKIPMKYDFLKKDFSNKCKINIDKNEYNFPLKSVVNEIIPDPNPSEIYPNLYLGEIYHSNDKIFLDEKNIKHILTLHENPCIASSNPDFSHIKFKHIRISDRHYVNIIQYFNECIEFIKSAHTKGENVYVHCAMGISRSVSIVIAYIMNTQNKTFQDALNYVRSRRPQADPNFGFCCQLMQYEQELKKNNDKNINI